MRLWSLHPNYLDRQGLIAGWREALLAQKVLLGATRGYTNHPQLTRFKNTKDPAAALGSFLSALAAEAATRGYRFNASKIERTQPEDAPLLSVTEGQLAYEWSHLERKLAQRSPEHLEHIFDSGHPNRNSSSTLWRPHPMFSVVPGGIEPWERPHTPSV